MVPFLTIDPRGVPFSPFLESWSPQHREECQSCLQRDQGNRNAEKPLYERTSIRIRKRRRRRQLIANELFASYYFSWLLLSLSLSHSLEYVSYLWLNCHSNYLDSFLLLESTTVSFVREMKCLIIRFTAKEDKEVQVRGKHNSTLATQCNVLQFLLSLNLSLFYSISLHSVVHPFIHLPHLCSYFSRIILEDLLLNNLSSLWNCYTRYVIRERRNVKKLNVSVSTYIY